MPSIVAKIKAKEGKESELEAILKDLAGKVHANEPNTLAYILHKDKKDSRTFVFYEKYKSEDDVKTHGSSEYFKEAGKKMASCMDGKAEIQFLEELA